MRRHAQKPFHIGRAMAILRDSANANGANGTCNRMRVQAIMHQRFGIDVNLELQQKWALETKKKVIRGFIFITKRNKK